MRSATLAIAFLIAIGSPASATAGPMSVVHQFIDGLNSGNMASALAACEPSASIVDEFPPHEWQGLAACAHWARDFEAYGTANGITGGIVTLETPRHVDQSGDRAYVVVPAIYTYKARGKRVTESGSILTVALKRTTAGWRITGWAWAKR